uniref:Uncharacterized protein n=1 Tax=Anguilla anguilla TaxID=7936 RepID=A0A0E9U900_ANGAN
MGCNGCKLMAMVYLLPCRLKWRIKCCMYIYMCG